MAGALWVCGWKGTFRNSPRGAPKSGPQRDIAGTACDCYTWSEGPDLIWSDLIQGALSPRHEGPRRRFVIIFSEDVWSRFLAKLKPVGTTIWKCQEFAVAVGSGLMASVQMQAMDLGLHPCNLHVLLRQLMIQTFRPIFYKHMFVHQIGTYMYVVDWQKLGNILSFIRRFILTIPSLHFVEPAARQENATWSCGTKRLGAPHSGLHDCRATSGRGVVMSGMVSHMVGKHENLQVHYWWYHIGWEIHLWKLGGLITGGIVTMQVLRREPLILIANTSQVWHDSHPSHIGVTAVGHSGPGFQWDWDQLIREGAVGSDGTERRSGQFFCRHKPWWWRNGLCWPGDLQRLD